MISIKIPLAGCALAAALGAAAAAGVARAQPMGAPSGAPNPAAQQQRLHDALHLNPHQDQAWRAYQAGIQPSPDQVQQLRAISQMSLAGMSTPQRLDMIDQGLSLQAASFHRTANATRTFYATLSPEQQHTFDQITAPPSRGGGQGR